MPEVAQSDFETFEVGILAIFGQFFGKLLPYCRKFSKK
jgi:hypothetical protein